MTVKELKELLQSFINHLDENYVDTETVEVVNNTYFLHCGYNFIGTPKGFVDLDYPTGELEEDEE